MIILNNLLSNLNRLTTQTYAYAEDFSACSQITPTTLAQAQAKIGVSKLVAPKQIPADTKKKPTATIHTGGRFCAMRAIG